jgi:hypothetical protein
MSSGSTSEDKTKHNEEMHKLALEMYPGVMKILQVWLYIVEKFYYIVLFLGVGFFFLFIICALCKALWWVLFVWRF